MGLVSGNAVSFVGGGFQGWPVITVPLELAAWRVRMDGDAGRRWVAALPALVERLVRQWDLDVDDAEPLHGAAGLVVLVHRGAQPLALKVGRLEDTTAGEASALRAWNGHGAVRLVAAEPEHAALLMERLDHTRSLGGLPLPEAATIAGALIRTLAVPAPDGIRLLSEVAAGIHESLPGRQRALGDPVPASWLAAATRWAAELTTTGERVLLHADLHYGNVLAGADGQWRAVDPRPMVGAPEYSVPEMMWNRAGELHSAAEIRQLLGVIVGAGGLDLEIARRWVVTRCVDYWLWGMAHGLDIDPAHCQRIVGVLLPGQVAGTVRRSGAFGVDQVRDPAATRISGGAGPPVAYRKRFSGQGGGELQ